ncbi:MAG: hypothetical protein FJW35_00935 [Acidobacteria bacterium]|nr:hypothetical protein [Acidobacteriota bacterium]
MMLLRNSRPDIDDLLKKALGDDLPPEAETRMAARLQEFRRATEGNAISRSAPFAPELAGGHWIFGSRLLACASAIIIMFGAALHLGGRRSVLADSISLTKTSISVAQQLRHATVMECRVKSSLGTSAPAAWRIRWVSPDKTRIDISEGDGTQRTYWLQGETTAMSGVSHPTATYLDVAQRLQDPLLSAVLPLVSPAELARHLSAAWSLKHDGRQDGRAAASLKYHDPQVPAEIELAVDDGTLLPSRLTRRRQDQSQTGVNAAWPLEAQFYWNVSVDPALMAPAAGAR